MYIASSASRAFALVTSFAFSLAASLAHRRIRASSMVDTGTCDAVLNSTTTTMNGNVNGSNGHANGDHERSVAVRNNQNANKVTVVLGAQWGDEGKGKLVDLLAASTKIVCRCQVSVPNRCRGT